MAIKSVTQRGNYVYILKESGGTSTAPGDLVGFTSSTVTVRRGNFNYFYNENGTNTGQTHAN
jgi:hypothetical protein